MNFISTRRPTCGTYWRPSRGASCSSTSKSWAPGNGIPTARSIPEGDDLHGQAPTPEEAAIAADLMEQALAGLNETYVEVFHLRLQNCTEEEIAARLGCTRTFVRTRLHRIREQLKRLSDGGN